MLSALAPFFQIELKYKSSLVRLVQVMFLLSAVAPSSPIELLFNTRVARLVHVLLLLSAVASSSPIKLLDKLRVVRLRLEKFALQLEKFQKIGGILIPGQQRL